jgi:hypothetical protein
MDMTDVAVRRMNYALLSQELNTLYVAGMSTGHHLAHDTESHTGQDSTGIT